VSLVKQVYASVARGDVPGMLARVRDGKLRGFQQFTDTAQFANILGS
jgi:ketosteroid isomerase-like protein